VREVAGHWSGAPLASLLDGPLWVKKVWGAPEHRLPRERFVPPSNSPLTAEECSGDTPNLSLEERCGSSIPPPTLRNSL
jgi:hypothetical protein